MLVTKHDFATICADEQELADPCMAGVVLTVLLRVLLRQLGISNLESARVLKLIVSVAVVSEHEQGALSVVLLVRVEGSLIWDDILCEEVLIKLKLSDESLLVPEPDYKPELGFSGLVTFKSKQGY